jgi:hypothetical protein
MLISSYRKCSPNTACWLVYLKTNFPCDCRQEYENDMFLVVRAANGYKADAQVEVETYLRENQSLKEKISILEGKLKSMGEPAVSVRRKGVGVQVLLGDNKSNKRENNEINDNDGGSSLHASKSSQPHDSDKENRVINGALLSESEGDQKNTNATVSVKRANLPALNSTKIMELGSSSKQG